jgi:hypothetical protein
VGEGERDGYAGIKASIKQDKCVSPAKKRERLGEKKRKS